MVQHAELTRDDAAQAVCPSEVAADQLGGSGTNISVAAGVTSTQSDPAPRNGVMIVSMFAGMAARVRINQNPTAVGTDQGYMGPNVWHFPVKAGDRISFFGEAGITTANVSVGMAKG